MSSSRAAARKLSKVLKNTYQTRRRMARAVVTAVQRDSAGRAIGVTASIDGATSQRVYIDHGSTITVGDIYEVENRGGTAGPAWFAMRRVSTTIPVPALPFGTELPTPTGLSLTTGSYIPAKGSGSVSWIYASFKTIPGYYGMVGYECQVRRNTTPDDEDPMTQMMLDPRLYTYLVDDITNSQTVIPRAPTQADFDFAKEGVIQIESENIFYTAATRRAGIWLYPSYLTSTTFSLYDYVEDDFGDTTGTDIILHTPDYDRYAGGWYVIPTYSSNWEINNLQLWAQPGGTWPYSAVLIASSASAWGRHRLRGDWTMPSSGKFGYIIDYDDAANLVYVRINKTSGELEIVERVSSSESILWADAVDLTATETYTFTVNVVNLNVYITISGGDLGNETIDYSLTTVLSKTCDSPVVGLYSEVAVYLDNFFLDDAREREIVDDEWIDYCYFAGGQTHARITDNGYNATGHSHDFTLATNPGATGGTIYPAFVGCTRGYDGTTAAAHDAGVGIYAQSLGFLLQPLVGAVDYNVRVRAVLSNTVISDWTDWSTIESAEDSSAPDAPSNFSAAPLVNGVQLTWDEYSVDVPDLAGFKIYRTTESDGSSPVLIATITGYEYFSPSAAAEVYYYNIKAFDFSGNLSAYGESTWVEGQAVYTDGTNILTNTDFERDLDASGDADTWDGYVNATYGAYGIGGGQGYRLDPPPVTILPQYARLLWDPADNGILIKPVADQYMIVSCYVKPDNPATMGFGWNDSGSTTVWPGFIFSDGSTAWAGLIFTPGQDDYFGWEELADGWYRLWGRHKVTSSEISSTPYVGVVVQCMSGGGDRYCDMDRIQLEYGYEPSQWKPGLVQPAVSGGLTGLSFDIMGIVSDSFALNGDGEIVSHLEPAADGTYQLGNDQNWKLLLLEDGITAPSGASGDANIFVDTSDSKLKVRHGTSTPVSLEDSSGDEWTYLTTPLGSTSWDGDSFSTTGKTLIDLSADFSVPAGVKAILVSAAVRDSAAVGNDCYLLLAPNNTSGTGAGFPCIPIQDRWYRSPMVVVPCTASGDVYYQIAASGTDTFDVYLYIWGYLPG